MDKVEFTDITDDSKIISLLICLYFREDFLLLIIQKRLNQWNISSFLRWWFGTLIFIWKESEDKGYSNLFSSAIH